MSEGNFLRTLKTAFESNGAFYFKIPDMPHVPGGATRFDIKKPFDAIAKYGPTTHAIEAKFLKDREAFGLRHFRPNQISGLDAWEAQHPGTAWTFLNVKTQPDYRKGIPYTNRMYIFPWAVMKERSVFTAKDLDNYKHCYSGSSRAVEITIEQFLNMPEFFK